MEPSDERRNGPERLHILEAFAVALERRAELVDLVGECKSAEQARARLQDEWALTEIQAAAVLDLQVRRFGQLERERIARESDDLVRRLSAGE